MNPDKNINIKKPELLAPAGSLANLKAAVVSGADAIYMGFGRHNARAYATNFSRKYFIEALKICKSNNVKIYLTMNTLVKNEEIKQWFDDLSYAYSIGIDAVIIQEIFLIPLIKKNFPGLKVHISTQAGVMNSLHAKSLDANRINLARELKKEEIKEIKKKFNGEIEIFCHGALCVCISGKCLFSSFLGGRSGNRGKCAQPCRKRYNDEYALSTKELCLIEKINDIIDLGIDSIKIEGRMRTPYYVAKTVSTYRDAINSKKIDILSLKKVFSREFTYGWFLSKNIFNRKKADAKITMHKERYEPVVKNITIDKKRTSITLPKIKEKKCSKKELIVKVYSKEDAITAFENGADIVCIDIFSEIDNQLGKIYGELPRIMLDKDIPLIKERIKKFDGLIGFDPGVLSLNKEAMLDYNLFNDIDISHIKNPIMSMELSINELKKFRNKNFIVRVHGKIRLMVLRNDPERKVLKDKKGKFIVNKIYNGFEIINNKELGMLSKAKELYNAGIKRFIIDTDKNVGKIVRFYRNILDGKHPDDRKIKKKYVLGWSYKGVE